MAEAAFRTGVCAYSVQTVEAGDEWWWREELEEVKIHLYMGGRLIDRIGASSRTRTCAAGAIKQKVGCLLTQAIHGLRGYAPLFVSNLAFLPNWADE